MWYNAGVYHVCTSHLTVVLPLTNRRLRAADEAVHLAGEDSLVGAATWLHADHLIKALREAPPSCLQDDRECDWCGQLSHAAPGTGCATCAFAWYCSTDCAVSANPHHFVHCAPLKRLVCTTDLFAS